MDLVCNKIHFLRQLSSSLSFAARNLQVDTFNIRIAQDNLSL